MNICKIIGYIYCIFLIFHDVLSSRLFLSSPYRQMVTGSYISHYVKFMEFNLMFKSFCPEISSFSSLERSDRWEGGLVQLRRNLKSIMRNRNSCYRLEKKRVEVKSEKKGLIFYVLESIKCKVLLLKCLLLTGKTCVMGRII